MKRWLIAAIILFWVLGISGTAVLGWRGRVEAERDTTSPGRGSLSPAEARRVLGNAGFGSRIDLSAIHLPCSHPCGYYAFAAGETRAVCIQGHRWRRDSRNEWVPD